jgi:hypothetical protein
VSELLALGMLARRGLRPSLARPDLPFPSDISAETADALAIPRRRWRTPASPRPRRRNALHVACRRTSGHHDYCWARCQAREFGSVSVVRSSLVHYALATACAITGQGVNGAAGGQSGPNWRARERGGLFRIVNSRIRRSVDLASAHQDGDACTLVHNTSPARTSLISARVNPRRRSFRASSASGMPSGTVPNVPDIVGTGVTSPPVDVQQPRIVRHTVGNGSTSANNPQTETVFVVRRA